MKQKNILTKNAPEPLGPYSQAIVAGNLIFVSGQIGIDPQKNLLTEGVEAQALQALKNIDSVLAAGGTKKENIVRYEILLADLNDFASVNKICGDFFSADPKPARQTCGGLKLPKNAAVEISCIAVKEK
jgi:2-iminobutanoate/2-iminopropanoate deaminase